MAGVRQFDEEVVLDRALELFWKKGYAETTMQELAAATGVQRGSLYNAYQGKDALFLKVFDVYMDRFLAQVDASLNQTDLATALTAFFDFVIDSMMVGTPTRGCLTSKTAIGGETIEEPVRQVLQKLVDRLEITLKDCFERSGVDIMTSPAEAARLIVTFTRGMVVIERVYQDKKRLVDTAGMLVRLLLGTAKST